LKLSLKKAMSFVIVIVFLMSFCNSTIASAATYYKTVNGTLNAGRSDQPGKAVIQYSIRFSYDGRNVSVLNNNYEVISSNVTVKIVPTVTTGKVSNAIYFNNVLQSTLVATCSPTGVADIYTY
jgi:hypothetical protein